jgi:hypothetical protein
MTMAPGLLVDPAVGFRLPVPHERAQWRTIRLTKPIATRMPWRLAGFSLVGGASACQSGFTYNTAAAIAGEPILAPLA